jgi:hypothetical protein
VDGEVDVIGDAANRDGFALQVANDAAEIGVEAGSEFVVDEGLPVLGSEDEVVEQVGVGVGHDGSSPHGGRRGLRICRPYGAEIRGTAVLPHGWRRGLRIYRPSGAEARGLARKGQASSGGSPAFAALGT